MFADVRSTLETRLATVSGIPATSRWALENRVYEPEPGTVWLGARLSPGAERLMTLPARNGWLRRPGVWRLTLHFPIGSGIGESDTLSAAILAAFPAGLTIAMPGGTDLRIDGGRRWSAASIGAEFTVPIDIYWHVLTINPLT